MSTQTISKRNTTPVTIPIPKAWLSVLKKAVSDADSDRSKYTRAAIKEKLERDGIKVPMNLH